MTVDRSGAHIVPARAEHRLPIESLLRRTGLFRDGEVGVALEVLDVYLFRDGQEDYEIYTASMEGEVAGFVCFGFNALTVGTFDLYWIAVDPPFQGRGVGADLMAIVESEARRRGGRMVTVETSSRADYGPALRFYRRRGYAEEARVADYYGPGDDKVIFVKRF